MGDSRRRRRAVVVAVLAGCVIAPSVDVPAEHTLVVAWGLIGLGLGLALLHRIREHAHFSRRMRSCTVPTPVAGFTVRLGAPRRSAFVAGLVRPEIYCDRVLLDELDPGELRAVLLHEQAHQRARDPLRMLATDALLRFITWSHRGNTWRERILARREIAADRYALSAGATRPAILSALMKVAPVSVGEAAAFSPATEMRLQALLDHELPPAGPRWRSVAAGLALGLTGCLAIVHPIITHLPV